MDDNQQSQVKGVNRVLFLDNIKALMIVLVIFIHTAVTYSDIGSWIEMEPHRLGKATFYSFLFFQTFTQAYFMSLLFMIAAYFIPYSINKKGSVRFIIDRFYRLGIPTLIFIFIIGPILEKIVHPEVSVINFYREKLLTWKFISWSGPMWFAGVLLTFSLLYAIVRPWIDKIVSKRPIIINTKNILMLIGIITMVAFGIRLVYPIGTSVYNIQLCYFSAYIFMFLVGIVAFHQDWFNRLDYLTSKRWFIAAFAIGVPLWILITSDAVSDQTGHYSPAFGGWNWLAFGYALWESFFCVAVIIGLIGIFREHFNLQNRLQRFMSANAFGVYVFHPLILVSISVLLTHVELPPLLKFIVVSGITVPLCFVFVYLLRKITILHRIFA